MPSPSLPCFSHYWQPMPQTERGRSPRNAVYQIFDGLTFTELLLLTVGLIWSGWLAEASIEDAPAAEPILLGCWLAGGTTNNVVIRLVQNVVRSLSSTANLWETGSIFSSSFFSNPLTICSNCSFYFLKLIALHFIDLLGLIAQYRHDVLESNHCRHFIFRFWFQIKLTISGSLYSPFKYVSSCRTTSVFKPNSDRLRFFSSSRSSFCGSSVRLF